MRSWYRDNDKGWYLSNDGILLSDEVINIAGSFDRALDLLEQNESFKIACSISWSVDSDRLARRIVDVMVDAEQN